MSNPLIYTHIVIHAHIHIQQVVQYIFMHEQSANIYIQPYMYHHIHITHTAGCQIPRLNPTIWQKRRIIRTKETYTQPSANVHRPLSL